MKSLGNLVSMMRNASSTLQTRLRSTLQRPLALVLPLIAFSILQACAFGTGTPENRRLEVPRYIPCASAAPIVWAPGEVDDSLTGDALEKSRQDALDHIARVLSTGDKSNPAWKASAVALIREIAGDPSDVAGQIKGANAVYDDRCPTLEMPPASIATPPRVKPATP